MSKEKVKSKKKGKKPGRENILRRTVNRVVQFFRDARAEIRRVIWPTPRETRNLTLVVLVLSTILGLLMWAFDTLFSWLYRLLV